MAKIGLTEGFTLIPEGTHVFQITDVKYKEDFGKLEIYMPVSYTHLTLPTILRV